MFPQTTRGPSVEVQDRAVEARSDQLITRITVGPQLHSRMFPQTTRGPSVEVQDRVVEVSNDQLITRVTVAPYKSLFGRPPFICHHNTITMDGKEGDSLFNREWKSFCAITPSRWHAPEKKRDCRGFRIPQRDFDGSTAPRPHRSVLRPQPECLDGFINS